MTVRLLTDEHIARSLISGLRRLIDEVDVVRVQDAGLRTVDDPTILQWAADHGRVLVTHDVRTVPAFAYERVAAGPPMPGVFVLGAKVPTSVAIEELTLILTASDENDWINRVVYLPLR